MQLQADVPKPDKTLNRWRFGTLKTSQRNCRLWLSHGIFQRLLRAISRPALPAKCLPLPNGSSAIQLRLIWWVVSKSDTPRRPFGSKAFARRVPGAPTLQHDAHERRVAEEVISIDREYV